MPIDRRTVLAAPLAGAVGAGAGLMAKGADAKIHNVTAYADASALGVVPDRRRCHHSLASSNRQSGRWRRHIAFTAGRLQGHGSTLALGRHIARRGTCQPS